MRENRLLDAKAQGYAIGAFNVNTYDEMVAIAEAAQRRNLPVMLMASMSSARFFGPATFARLVRALDEFYSVPVISHLDHCTDRELLLECAAAGFDSVMFDGSPLPFEQNVEATLELSLKCHDLGVFIEGELGVIAGEEGPVKSAYSVFTEPDMAYAFCVRARVDSLAVSIGNVHGFYRGEPRLRFDILKEIAHKCSLPLVLHGGTGIPGRDVARAIGMGIAKVNVGTEIRAEYARSVLDYADEHRQDADARKFVAYLRERVGNSAGRYMDSFNPAGHTYA